MPGAQNGASASPGSSRVSGTSRWRAALALGQEGGLADEVGLGEVDEPVEAGLEGGEAGLQILLPAAVALVEAHGLDGVDADVADAAGGARRHDRLVGRQ